jgi:hypothetical protein
MVHAYRELTITRMLARSRNRTAAVVIFDLWEEGSLLLPGAFALVMFVVLMDGPQPGRPCDQPAVRRAGAARLIAVDRVCTHVSWVCGRFSTSSSRP